MESAFETVKAIIVEKEASKRHPLHALLIEIKARNNRADLMTELKMLVDQKLLITGRTINYQYFKMP